jgi:hypothetical protein
MRLLSGRLTLTADGRTLVPHWSSVSALPDRQSLKVSVVRAPAAGPAHGGGVLPAIRTTRHF